VLGRAVGADALRQLRGVIAIGATTAAALEALGVTSVTPARADFGAAAQALAVVRASGER
jgi:uroporphyrinogen-III synthase